MPLTKLDPVAALIVIDLQKGIVGLPTAHPTSEVVERSARLARRFRERSLPVDVLGIVGAPRFKKFAALLPIRANALSDPSRESRRDNHAAGWVGHKLPSDLPLLRAEEFAIVALVQDRKAPQHSLEAGQTAGDN